MQADQLPSLIIALTASQQIFPERGSPGMKPGSKDAKSTNTHCPYA